MNRILNFCLFVVLVCMSSQLAAQAPVFDDLVFEDDSITTAFKPKGKRYVYVKSKKGTGGVNHASGADSILNLKFPITDIVLVFTETNAGDINQRIDHNRERWENLLTTYPDFFQFNTNYKNLCQCNNAGDAEAFKGVQGFYIYFQGGAAAATAVEPVKETPKEVAVVEKKVEEKKAEPKHEEKAKEEKHKEVKEEKKEVVKEEKHKEEKVKEEKHKEVKEEKKEVVKEEKKEPEKVVEKAVVNNDETLGEEPEENTKPTSRQKAKFTTPKRAKDKKACRPPCYENGDEDLVNFFVNGIELTKKEKKHAKSWECFVTVILNFDGTIKKTMVTGTEVDFNKKVTSVMGTMQAWNPAVRNGITVKSQLKFKLAFDKSRKGFVPQEFNIIPRPGPKCVCVPDSELFAD